jgi:major membrane immunogen (membrane-anchored lipoprotein)
MVLFDENKSIKLVRVLVYRENYGGEVGSRRWLKQWIGISKPKYMVDAISGATISVNSLKQSINTLLTKV